MTSWYRLTNSSSASSDGPLGARRSATSRLTSSMTAKMAEKVSISPALIPRSLTHTECNDTEENQRASV